MTSPVFQLTEGDGPLVATAIHDGHELRPEVATLSALSDDARFREEDPFTREWVSVVPTNVVVLRSRFEFDLNRPKERAVYRKPSDAWGLDLWKAPLSDDVADRSLALYDEFYFAMHDLLKRIEERTGHFVVFDLHSYNHRRGGSDAPPADAGENPQVNLGTGSMDRERWAPIVDRFLGELSEFPFPGGRLDVRENVKFRGGNFSRWVHTTFPETGCVLAIEFKKFFMDEWTGEPYTESIEAIREALTAAALGITEELKQYAG